MRKVQRAEVLDYQTYADRRTELRASAMAAKSRRRVHLGPHLTFLFENSSTVLYQIQEMIRIERIVREKDVQHEIDTYNALLGGPGELGATLLIEIQEAEERDAKLRAWLGLPKYLFLRGEAGERLPARWDAAQVGEDRLSSVQYLRFQVGDAVPVAIACDHPELSLEVALDEAQRATLLADLRDTTGDDD